MSALDLQHRDTPRHFVALFFAGASFTPLSALIVNNPLPTAFSPLLNYPEILLQIILWICQQLNRDIGICHAILLLRFLLALHLHLHLRFFVTLCYLPPLLHYRICLRFLALRYCICLCPHGKTHRNLKSGLGQGLLAKIRNRTDIINMAHSSFFSLFISPYFLALFLFSLFPLFKWVTNIYQYFTKGVVNRAKD